MVLTCTNLGFLSQSFQFNIKKDVTCDVPSRADYLSIFGFKCPILPILLCITQLYFCATYMVYASAIHARCVHKLRDFLGLSIKVN